MSQPPAADVVPAPAVVFCRSTHRIIDLVTPGESHQAAIRRLAAYGTALTVLPLDEAATLYESRFKTEPVAISEAHFHEMLGVLPPVGWRNTASGESFKLSERTAGMITAIFVRINDRHFTFSDDIRTPHDDCCRRVAQSRAWREAESRSR